MRPPLTGILLAITTAIVTSFLATACMSNRRNFLVISRMGIPVQNLYQKICSYGISGQLLTWISSWLNGRRQRVQISGNKSGWLDVASGIPQGSVLGPLLFLMFINDLGADVTESTVILKFADDTKVLGICDNDLDHGVIQSDLHKLQQWADAWQMSFNVDKCKILHMGHGNMEYCYWLNGQELHHADTEKDLGILISNDLKVGLQCTEAYKKANKMLGLIRRTIVNKEPRILLALYKSLVRPHLEYCCSAWSPHYVKDKELLEKIQHRFTRMFKELKVLPYMDRIDRLGLWTLEERRNRADLIEVFKICNGYTTLSLEAFFEVDSYGRTRGHNWKLRKPHCTKGIRKYFFSSRVIDRWNKLTDDIVRSPSINSFKKKLRKVRDTRCCIFSAADPIPTAVLKEVAELLAPYFVELFNRSFATGQFPSTFKEAFITPIVKKPGLDVNDVASYRPISNLTVVSKVLERLAAHQLMDYLKASDLLPSMQSGFRPGHSTETAVLRVLADILQAVDCGDVAALVLLDLSAAFDTVDHSILLQRLNTTFGISATAHSWFRSYLSGRSQCVRRGSIRSSITRLLCGVPQGSVLGPILFIMYVADLVCLIQDHGLSAHQYADDTQVYGACRPAAVNALSSQITGCVDTVASWMKSNRLQLNADKTEVMWCATGRRQHQLPTTPLSVNGVPVQPVKSVRDLGVHIDGDLVMRTHVQRTVSRCFAVLRQLRQIRHVVPTSTFQTLVVSLVLSRLDYGNAVLVGLPAYLLNRLQSVLNAAARLIFGLRYTDHITEALVSLHWLRAPQRIQFKVAVLAYKVLNGSAPQYLGPLVRTADLPGRRPLRSTASNRLDVPRFRLTTVGSRAFPVAASRIWNDLPADVTSSPSLSIFRRRLKTVLFKLSHNID